MESEKLDGELSFSKILPLAGPFVIFLGVLRLITYYDSFGVQIIYFLEISEILTSFLSAIAYFIGYFTMYMILTYIFQSKEDQTELSEMKDSKFQQRLLDYLIQRGDIVVVVILGLPSIYFFKPELIFTIPVILLASLVGFSLQIILGEIFYKHKTLPTSKSHRNFINILLVLFLGYVFVSFLGYAEADKLKKTKSKNLIGTRILWDDNCTFFSNENYYYIGKTQGYVFLYSETKNEAEAIPMSRVKKLTFINE